VGAYYAWILDIDNKKGILVFSFYLNLIFIIGGSRTHEISRCQIISMKTISAFIGLVKTFKNKKITLFF
jgi:hypothetical protein